MKACETYIEQIMNSIDGALSLQEEQELQEHLAGCEGCRSLYRAYQKIDQGISEMEEEPPTGLVRAVMGSVCQERDKGHLFRRYRFTLIAAAAAVVLLVAGRYMPESAISKAATTSSAAESAAGDAATEEVVTAALQPRFEVAETTEADAETADAETEEAVPVEEVADETSGSGKASISDALEALHEDGYSGDLYALKMTEEELLEVLPDCERLTLSSGLVVFQTDQDTFYQVQYDLVSSGSIVADSDSEFVYFILQN